MERNDPNEIKKAIRRLNEAADSEASGEDFDEDPLSEDEESSDTDEQVCRPSRSFGSERVIYGICKQYPRLDRATELTLVEKAKKGDNRDKERLVLHSMAMIVSCAHSIQNKKPGNYQLVDLVQEGCCGLLKALKKFDPAKGMWFEKYALHLVRGEMFKFLRGSDRIIPVSRYRLDQVRRVMNSESAVEAREGRAATVDEISLATNLTPKLIRKVKTLKNDRTYTGSDENVQPEREEAAGKFSEPGPITEEKELTRQVQALLEETQLTEREREVIKLRFGFDQGRRWTLQEVGNLYDITRQAILKIENHALKKLRAQALSSSFFREFDRD